MPCHLSIHSGEDFTIDRTAADGNGSLSISLSAKNDLYCGIDVKEAGPSAPPIVSTLIPISAIWNLSYPSFWGPDASLSLTLRTSVKMIDSLRRLYFIPDDSIALHRWDIARNAWQKINSEVSKSAAIIEHHTSEVQPGMYGIFSSKLPATHTTEALAIANVGRIASHAYVRFKASAIKDIRIYSSNGTLLCRYIQGGSTAFQPDRQYSNAIMWNLTNQQGKVVTPGAYLAQVVRDDPLSDRTISTQHKIMVFP
jgi:hypothetical protein